MSRYATITKEFIIDAIRKETRLQAGRWLDLGDCPEDEGKEALPLKEVDCARCAVGAVLTRVLDPETPAGLAVEIAAEIAGDGDFAPSVELVLRETIGSGYGFDEDGLYKRLTLFAKDIVENRDQPMTALSAFFEGAISIVNELDGYRPTHESGVMERVRDRTIDFVRENFPETVEIYIDGAKPAEDVPCRTE